jgi:hypothetical protein
MPRRGAVLGTLSLDRGGEPLHRQLYGALREAILAGRLRPGTRLPATRTLARDVGAARNTVVTAFEQLVAEGYVESRVGDGTRVAAVLPRRCCTRAAPACRPRRAVRRPGCRVAAGDGARAARRPIRCGARSSLAGGRPVSARRLGTLARAACPPPGARQPDTHATGLPCCARPSPPISVRRAVSRATRRR